MGNTNSGCHNIGQNYLNNDKSEAKKITTDDNTNTGSKNHELFEILPADKFAGIFNAGNTCYCSSVLQALYATSPFRNNVLNYKPLISSNNVVYASSNTQSFTSFSSLQSADYRSTTFPRQKHYSNASISVAKVAELISKTEIGEKDSVIKNNMQKRELLKLRADNLLFALQELYSQIYEMKRKKPGKFDAKRFFNQFRNENPQFANFQQHDSHEFLHCILSRVKEVVDVENTIRTIARMQGMKTFRCSVKEEKFEVAEKKKKKGLGIFKKKNKVKLKATVEESSESKKFEEESRTRSSSVKSSNLQKLPVRVSYPNFVENIFGGVLTNETRCLACNSVSCKDETFLDLSLDIEDDVSLIHCFETFCAVETLTGDSKYVCDTCMCLQEAHKKVTIKKLPKVLMIHLKRFKYQESTQNYVKLNSKVSFPDKLNLNNFLQNESGDEEAGVFQLVSTVIHCGQGLSRGHYIAACRVSNDQFLLLDDEDSQLQNDLSEFHGEHSEKSNSRNSSPGKSSSATTENAYILIYQQLSTVDEHS